MSDDLAFPISSKTVLELNFYLNLFSKWLILPCKKEFKTYHYFEDFYLTIILKEIKLCFLVAHWPFCVLNNYCRN